MISPSEAQPKFVEKVSMTQILLVGTELPLLEGLAQSFATLGFTPKWGILDLAVK